MIQFCVLIFSHAKRKITQLTEYPLMYTMRHRYDLKALNIIFTVTIFHFFFLFPFFIFYFCFCYLFCFRNRVSFVALAVLELVLKIRLASNSLRLLLLFLLMFHELNLVLLHTKYSEVVTIFFEIFTGITQ